MVDRLETTGVVRKELVKPLHLTVPVARASGAETDTRIDHPYSIYQQLEVRKQVLIKGDVMSRFEVKSAETLESVRIISHLLNR